MTASNDGSVDQNGKRPHSRMKENSDDGDALNRVSSHVRKVGRFTLRGKTDDLPQSWWFASTAIPLLAATIGPLANVLSIAALATKWRVTLPNNGQLPEGTDDAGVNIPDPTWELILNAVSLGLGFFGNFFLLLNFTQRIRYIVALPVTIISWYFATGILIGITIAMEVYVPPIRPAETYSQGFWHAIIAATLYLIGSMLLMVNMLGYFLGHYPQQFDLDDHQRTLILQTMMFFTWLAGGAAVFAKVCDMSYANALYFCDVTVLTVGFGDVLATNDAGRGLVFPFSVIGIIFLGLMINSIHKFAAGISKEKVIRQHALNERERTFGRTVTSEKELRDRLGIPAKCKIEHLDNDSGEICGPPRHQTLGNFGNFETHGQNVVFRRRRRSNPSSALHAIGRGGAGRRKQHKPSFHNDTALRASRSKTAKLTRRREKLLLLREERDRFNAMRNIQSHTRRFKSYYSLSFSVLAFVILWCVGAAIFQLAERRIQGLTYFQTLYFCYVSLLTIGYGDYSPRSNAGKPFFIVWSLMAVPTMTILVSDLGDTVVRSVNKGTFTLADWTVMPKRGVWKDFLDNHPKIKEWLKRKNEEKRVERGFEMQNPDDEEAADPESGPVGINGDANDDNRLKTLTEDAVLSKQELALHLAKAIKRVAGDLRSSQTIKYSYEEWVEFGILIRFSARKSRRDSASGDGDASDDEDHDIRDASEDEEEQADVLEWDWIGENSPMMTGLSESEWVLERLCESLSRWTKRQAREAKLEKQTHHFKLTAPTFPIASHDGADVPGQFVPSRSRSVSRSARSSERIGGRRTRDISPVLSLGPLGVEVVKLNSRSSRESLRAGEG